MQMVIVDSEMSEQFLLSWHANVITRLFYVYALMHASTSSFFTSTHTDLSVYQAMQ